MGDLLVECPIHLDAISIHDILVFKCGHGFCEPCLDAHFDHHASSSLSCPTCRKSVRRTEAFPLFLAPGQPSTATQGSSRPTAGSSHAQLVRELGEAKAAHANCPGRFLELQNEVDTLRQADARHTQTIQHLRGRCELLRERWAGQADGSARAREDVIRLKEEVKKLRVEHHKTCKDLEQARNEVQTQHERVKQYQGYIERYKHKCDLEKKKRKAIEDANRLIAGREDESLMVIDANAPDMLHENGPDFGWLDEACKVKGDEPILSDDEDLEFERESEDDAQLNGFDTKGEQREGQAPGKLPQFPSDWNLKLEALDEPSSGTTRKRRHESRQTSGSKIVKIKIPVTHKPIGGPLVMDRQGRIKGVVTLGSRQKLNSKN